MINIDLSKVPSDEEPLIKQGLSLSGYNSIEEFAIQAMIKESKRLILDAGDTKLSNEDFDRFNAACKKGAEPNEKLKNAFKQ